MSCNRLARSAYEFVEKLLPEGEHEELVAHIRECPDCAEFHAAATKLSCKDFVEFLHEYVENELPAEQRDVFVQHMQFCPPCVHYLESYEKTIQLGRQFCTEGDELPGDVPEELVRAILAARRR